MKYLHTREDVIAKVREWRDNKSMLDRDRTILEDVLELLESSEDDTRDHHFVKVA